MSEIPQVHIIKDLELGDPNTGDERLVYPHLQAATAEHRRWERDRLGVVWDSESGGVAERAAARELGAAYLSCAATQVITAPTPEQHDVWATRFTETSIELYGAPQPEEALRLAGEEYRWLQGIVGQKGVEQDRVETLLGFFEPLVDGADLSAPEAANAPDRVLAELHEVLRARYQSIFDIINAKNKASFTAADLRDVLVQAHAWLAQQDASWGLWKVKEMDGSMFSVISDDRHLRAGMKRSPATLAGATSMIFHELFGHAGRSNNGYKVGDHLMATGLPEYLKFEEGLASLFGHAASGEQTAAPRDHYVNIALALGTLGCEPQPRHQLLEISHNREIIRRQEDGTYGSLAPEVLLQRARARVNRIFRGSRGDSFGARPAVLTKEIVYHKGYKKAEEYIQAQRDNGRSMEEIFDYVQLGQFDPTDEQHAAYVLQVTGRSL